jgi:hypothetical protein
MELSSVFRSAARALVLPVMLAGATAAGAAGGCTCFRGSLDELRCETDADCTDGRVCREAMSGQLYCVFEDGGVVPDSGARDSGLDAGTDSGPVACTGDLDCTPMNTACRTWSCDTVAGVCVSTDAVDGTTCGDALFCTNPDTCTNGLCGGPTRDCSVVENQCNGSMCSEAAAACLPVPLTATACDDGATCTTDACAAGTCVGTPNEALCGAAEICDPGAYAGTGCGAVPDNLAVTCTGPQPAGTPGSCAVSLDSSGTPIPGEAARITCTAVPQPVQMFFDDFGTGAGSFAAGWSPTGTGTPTTNSDLGGNPAAVAVNGTAWSSDIVLPSVAGLSVLCLDFDVAQQGANGGELIEWRAEFDMAGFSSPIFSLDFGSWETNATIQAFNRNVCVNVTPGAATARLRLEMTNGDHKVYVDNVRVTGLAAPFTTPPGGGPDSFDTPPFMGTLPGWMTVSGTPTTTTLGVNNVLLADNTSFTISRVVDGSACDVVDVDFDFGRDNTDLGETLTFSVVVEGTTTLMVEFFDFLGGAWNVDGALLPWFGLRRITDLLPAAIRSASLEMRFALTSDSGGKIVYADEFVARCADLPDPTVGPLTDNGDGTYAVPVDSTAPVRAVVTCTWNTSDGDGPLDGTGSTTFSVP